MAKAREQVQRDNAIIRAKLRGQSWTKIAEDAGVTEDRCRQVFRDWKENNPTLRHHDPVEIVDELLLELTGMKEQLAEVDTANKAEQIAAINARRAVLHDITGLLMATGTLPRDLGQL